MNYKLPSYHFVITVNVPYFIGEIYTVNSSPDGEAMSDSYSLGDLHDVLIHEHAPFVHALLVTVNILKSYAPHRWDGLIHTLK